MLKMFNPDAHGKGLGLHGNVLGGQHGKGVPGAVANGQNQLAAGDPLPAAGSLQSDPREASVSVFQTGERGLKPDRAPQLLHPAAQVLHHGEEHVGPHMGLGVIEDLLLGAALDQLLQDPVIPGVVSAGVQLSVGEGPGAALSELHIAPGVQTAGLPEFLHQPVAGGGVPAPFQDQRPKAGLRQNQGGKHACRTKACHNGPLPGGMDGVGDLIAEDGGGTGLGAALADGPVLPVGDGDVYGIDPLNAFFFSGVQGTPGDLQGLDLPRRQTKRLGCRCPKGLRGVTGWEGDVADSNHGVSFPAAVPAA